MHQAVRTYSKLMEFPTFDERIEYLKLWDEPHIAPSSELYYKFLKSRMWRDFRPTIIDRDLGCDLGVLGRYPDVKIIVHHLDPIEDSDLINFNYDKLVNPENVITTGLTTHNTIHYKTEEKLEVVLERQPNDTKLW